MLPLLLLLVLPFVEIALFIEVGGALGLWATLGLVVASGVAGLMVLQAQGRGASADLQRRVERGEDPAGPLADAVLRLIAGVALLAPGFFTDAVGLALLLPPVRALVIAWGAARFATRVHMQGMTLRGGAFRTGPRGPGGPAGPAGRGDVVEGEYERLDDPDAHGDDRPAPPRG